MSTKTATKTPTKKATAKPKAEPAKPMTRNELLAALAERKYDGPVSFTAATLRDVLTWLDAGANPGDESIPTGVRYAIHPALRPTPKAKTPRPSKARIAALSEVAALLDKGTTVANLKKWLAEQTEAGDQ